jgi:hypothetical protein
MSCLGQHLCVIENGLLDRAGNTEYPAFDLSHGAL